MNFAIQCRRPYGKAVVNIVQAGGRSLIQRLCSHPILENSSRAARWAQAAPRFLGDLSQGFAAFVKPACSAPKSLSREAVRRFGRMEAWFVMLAGVSFLLGHASSGEEQQTLAPLAPCLAAACAKEATRNRAIAPRPSIPKGTRAVQGPRASYPGPLGKRIAGA